jgi:hypothetical protein
VQLAATAPEQELEQLWRWAAGASAPLLIAINKTTLYIRKSSFETIN